MTARADWIVHRSGASAPLLRLWCFPYAGGSAAAYRSWGRALPAGAELCPVELPGHGTRFTEVGMGNLQELVSALADAIGPQMDVPAVFFGHSLGAVIAFELARELRRRDRPEPLHLIVSARPAPSAPIPGPFTYDLPEGEFRPAIERRYGIALPILDRPGAIELMLATMRSDIELHETYRYRKEQPLACSLSAWAGTDDPLAAPEDMEGWEAESTGPFRLLPFPGHHFYQRSGEDAVLESLSRVLSCELSGAAGSGNA